MTPQEMFDELNIPWMATGHEHCQEGWVQIDCPHCTPNAQHWRLGYNTQYGYLNCWSCGRMQLIDTLMAASGLTFARVKEVVLQVERKVIHNVVAPRAGGRLKLPGGRGPLLKPHKRYLKKRGFDWEEIVELWGVEGIGPGHSLAWRLFIPIHHHGEVVSWTTRSISDEHGLRYRSAKPEQEKYLHKDLLYGADYCRHAVIIVEGPLDVWATGPGAVATFGLSLKRAQLLALSRYAVRCVCFDNEPAAQLRARELCNDLSVFSGDTLNVTFSSGKDASRAPRKEILQLRKMVLG